MVKPVEYNHAGLRLELARLYERYRLKPFGPNSPARCDCVVLDVNEPAQSVTVADERQQLVLTFDEWDWMQAEHVC